MQQTAYTATDASPAAQGPVWAPVGLRGRPARTYECQTVQPVRRELSAGPSRSEKVTVVVFVVLVYALWIVAAREIHRRL